MVKSSQSKLLIVAYLIAICHFTSVSVLAQPGFEAIFDPRFGQLKTTLSVESESHDSRAIKGSAEDMAYHFEQLRLSLPIKQDENSELAFRFQGSVMDIASDVTLPDTGEKFPDHLWDLRFGGLYRKNLGQGQFWGLMADIGSPSDRPFASFDEVSLNISAFLHKPKSRSEAWVYFLNVSNNREFLPWVPLPGVGYLWNKPNQSRGLIGLPASFVNVAINENVTIQASYFLIRTIQAQINFAITEQLKLYSRFNWGSRRYFRDARKDDDDRLFYYEKKVTTGANVQLSENVVLDLFAGYAFDRFYFEGEEYDDRGDNRLSISDGPFAGVSAKISF